MIGHLPPGDVDCGVARGPSCPRCQQATQPLLEIGRGAMANQTGAASWDWKGQMESRPSLLGAEG